MLPDFILPETTVHEKGAGPALQLGEAAGRMLLLTLGITDIVEQQSLDVAVWGSPDRENWGEGSILSFPQKFYCGTSQILLDLSAHPDAKFLRAEWKVNRWGVGSKTPMFKFYVFAEPFAGTVLEKRSA